jgi:uncharacterized membrane protein YccC
VSRRNGTHSTPSGVNDEHLRAAYRRMEDGRRVIDCQRVLIATRKALGESTAQLEELLATFENAQAELESDLVRIRGDDES